MVFNASKTFQINFLGKHNVCIVYSILYDKCLEMFVNLITF